MSSSAKLSRTISDIEKGDTFNSQDIPSIKTSGYKVVRKSTQRNQRSHQSTHNAAALRSTQKAMEYTRKVSAADRIKKHWKDYKRRNPKEPAFQKMLRTTATAFKNTFSKLLLLKGGKKTQKRKKL